MKKKEKIYSKNFSIKDRDMDQIQYQRELLSFAEKIALAKLEESKASERVRELEYQRERFALDAFVMNVKEEMKQKNSQ